MGISLWPTFTLTSSYTTFLPNSLIRSCRTIFVNNLNYTVLQNQKTLRCEPCIKCSETNVVAFIEMLQRLKVNHLFEYRDKQCEKWQKLQSVVVWCLALTTKCPITIARTTVISYSHQSGKHYSAPCRLQDCTSLSSLKSIWLMVTLFFIKDGKTATKKIKLSLRQIFPWFCIGFGSVTSFFFSCFASFFTL